MQYELASTPLTKTGTKYDNYGKLRRNSLPCKRAYPKLEEIEEISHLFMVKKPPGYKPQHKPKMPKVIEPNEAANEYLKDLYLKRLREIQAWKGQSLEESKESLRHQLTISARASSPLKINKQGSSIAVSSPSKRKLDPSDDMVGDSSPQKFGS